MITFQSTETVRMAMGTLEYREDDLAFDTTPRPVGAVSSLMLNDVELMSDELTGAILFVTGYCPFQSWIPAQLDPPPSQRNVLIPVLDTTLQPGVSVTLHHHPHGDRWPVFVDPETGWVRLGLGQEHPAEVIQFAPGALAVLDDNRALRALWLRPVALPRGFSGSSRNQVS